MARLLSILFALLFPVLVACGSDAPAEEATDAGVVRMSAAEFAEAAAGPGVVILDVRTPQEYDAGHLPDAVNLDVSDPGFEQALADLDPEASYAVYCQSGNRSLVAAETMLRAGFEDVFDLEGGIAAWQGDVVR